MDGATTSTGAATGTGAAIGTGAGGAASLDRVPTGDPAAASGNPCPVGDDRITLMGLLVETYAHLTKILGAELEQTCGVPLTWFDVLIRLARSPEEHLTMTQLAAEVSLTSGGITRLVDRIAEAGYVERQSCPSDRRSMFVALTPSGWAKLHETVDVHLKGLDQHLIGPLTAAERGVLDTALRKLRGDGPVCGG